MGGGDVGMNNTIYGPWHCGPLALCLLRVSTTKWVGVQRAAVIMSMISLLHEADGGEREPMRHNRVRQWLFKAAWQDSEDSISAILGSGTRVAVSIE